MPIYIVIFIISDKTMGQRRSDVKFPQCRGWQWSVTTKTPRKTRLSCMWCRDSSQSRPASAGHSLCVLVTQTATQTCGTDLWPSLSKQQQQQQQQ